MFFSYLNLLSLGIVLYCIRISTFGLQTGNRCYYYYYYYYYYY